MKGDGEKPDLDLQEDLRFWGSCTVVALKVSICLGRSNVQSSSPVISSRCRD